MIGRNLCHLGPGNPGGSISDIGYLSPVYETAEYRQRSDSQPGTSKVVDGIVGSR